CSRMGLLSRPWGLRPRIAMGGGPAVRSKGLVEYGANTLPEGVTVATTTLSTRTWKVCWLPGRWAAVRLRTYVPAARSTVWLIEPVPCNKATWLPSGALGLLKALPLRARPAWPVKVQGEPVGS